MFARGELGQAEPALASSESRLAKRRSTVHLRDVERAADRLLAGGILEWRQLKFRDHREKVIENI